MTSTKAFTGFMSIILSVVLVVGFMPLPAQRAYADDAQTAPAASTQASDTAQQKAGGSLAIQADSGTLQATGGLQLTDGQQLEPQAKVTVSMLKSLSIKKGKTQTLTIDSIVDNDKVWYSTKPAIASVKTVNGKGVVTAKKAGKTIVYVHCRTIDKRYGVYLTVKGPKKVALSKKKLTLAKGKKATLKLKNATASKVKWTSKNKKVAIVTKKGVVKAKKVGTAKIIAAYKGKKYVCKLTVKAPKKIALSKKKLALSKGGKATLKLKNAKASKVKWTSKSSRIATVSKKGVVTAKRAGKTTVVAKYKGKTYSCKVTVKGSSVKVKQTKNGSTTVKLKKGKKTTVGSLKKKGYQVVIPAGALPAGTKVKVTVKDGRVDLTAVGKKYVRLNKVATVKLALTGKVPASEVDNWWGVYSYAGETHLLQPNLKQLRKGVLQYQVSYFTQAGGQLSTQSANGLSAQGESNLQTQAASSWFGSKKLSDKELRAAVAYASAVNDFSKDAQNDAVQSLVESCFGAAADSLGFKAGDPGRDKIMKQLGKSSDLMALVRAARSGDEAAFTGKAAEMLTKIVVENADGTKVGYLGAAAGSIPGVLQDVKKGDYKGAATRVAKAVTSNIPYVKAVQFTAALTEATIDYYVDTETEAAYKAYYGQLKNGAFGYSTASDTAWNLVSRQMAAPLRQMNIRAIQAYADAHGVSVNSLTEAQKDKIRATVDGWFL